MENIRLFGQGLNALHPNDVEMQQQAVHSPTDSDYFSECERDSQFDVDEDNSPMNPAIEFSVSEDWIELDLSRNSPLSLGFLSDLDFQAVLESFAEFTSHQLRSGVSNPREMEGLLTNHLAYLLWRRTVVSKLQQLPPISVEAEQLNILLDDKWRAETNVYNRERFRTLADATTVPQLILSTIQSYFRKRQPERTAADVIRHKKLRRN